MESEMNDNISSSRKVSIIVPVYNAERFISACIDSIINQSYTNIELILVIDGSPDNSASICYKYEKKDKRVIVIEKENGGVSSARNVGILKATGDYISFVDADDEIAPTMIEKMMACIKKIHGDLCICGFEVKGANNVLNDTESLVRLPEIINKETLIQAIIDTSKKRIMGYALRCLYRRNVIIDNSIIFPEKIKISEDYMFFLNYAVHANIICVLPEELYYYKINDSSATAKYMPSLHSDMHSINEWMRNNVCTPFPMTEVGYHCCEANTYLRTIQNLCRKGTPYTLYDRIKHAYKIKNQYGYEKELWKAIKDSKNLSIKNLVSYTALFLFQDWLYIVLFSFKNKT